MLSVDTIKYPLTGIGRYTLELARQLQYSQLLDDIKFIREYNILCEIPDIQTDINSSILKTRIKSCVQKNYLLSELYRIITPCLKKSALKEYKDFIYHGTNFYLPPFPGKKIATFHDLSVFTWPQCHPKERVRYMRKELMLTLQRADMLITDSEFTRSELCNYFNYPLNKVTAIPLASSGDFYPQSVIDIQPFLTHYGLQANSYVLFAGSIEPRKNLDVLLTAYQRLSNKLRKHYPLVICGYHGWQSEELHLRMAEAERQGWLRYLGYVAAKELPTLFSGARLFVFPSLYEGFGLPVLEAMACGIPVISSNAASLPEVAGNVALLFDPTDPDDLLRHLIRGIEDLEWRKEASNAGVQRAKQFSWQRCARNTLSVYQQVN